MMKSAAKAVSEIGKDFVFAPFQPIIQPIIHDVLKEHQKDNFRKGTILTPCVLVWLCFALVLRRNLNCKKVLDWLFSGFRWESLNFTNHIVKDGTISHARLKMGVDVFRDIFNRFVSTFKDKATPDFYGLVTVMFDGVSMTTPDTKSNLERFGKHKFLVLTWLMAAISPYSKVKLLNPLILTQAVQNGKRRKSWFALSISVFQASVLFVSSQNEQKTNLNM